MIRALINIFVNIFNSLNRHTNFHIDMCLVSIAEVWIIRYYSIVIVGKSISTNIGVTIIPPSI